MLCRTIQYLIEQEFYESAMNGLQWIIDHRDDAWPGVEAQSHGIDIISLSWGITSHEEGAPMDRTCIAEFWTRLWN